jgi:hypothetical protein
VDTCFDLKPAEGANKMSGDTELTLEEGAPHLDLRVLQPECLPDSAPVHFEAVPLSNHEPKLLTTCRRDDQTRRTDR